MLFYTLISGRHQVLPAVGAPACRSALAAWKSPTSPCAVVLQMCTLDGRHVVWCRGGLSERRPAQLVRACLLQQLHGQYDAGLWGLEHRHRQE